MTVTDPLTAPPGIWCAELELSTETLTSRVAPEPGHRSVRALVRWHGRTLGYLTVAQPPEEVTGATVAAAAREMFTELPEPVPSPAPADGPSVSVVVCTRNRADQLAEALRVLQELTYPHLEIVIVDNAPSDDATRAVVTRAAEHDDRIRYAVEPRPGLSCARNRGLAEATGRLIAYTDDDVSVDPDWVDQLVAAFAAGPGIGCVTGLVCTASLTTRAEMYFDARASSWSTRVEPVTYDLGEHRLDDALYPYSAGVFGTGANFAFERRLLMELGGFDEALGAGTATKGGEDLDIFVRVLRSGHAIRYEPSAVVWHHHRADDQALVQQMYGYGTGLTAYLAKLMLQRDTRNDIVRRVPRGLKRMVAIKRTTDERMDRVSPPPGALRREFLGYLTGPYLYWKARRRSARGDIPVG